MSKLTDQALALHKEHHGKIEMHSKVPLQKAKDLTLAYSPGVAAPCLEIKKDYNKSTTTPTRQHSCRRDEWQCRPRSRQHRRWRGLPVMEASPSCSRALLALTPSPSASTRRTSTRLSALSSSWRRRWRHQPRGHQGTAVL